MVEKAIFEKLPKACFGVVMAKGIDNSKAYPAIDRLLNESITAAAQRFEGKKVKEEPDILPYREAFRTLLIVRSRFICQSIDHPLHNNRILCNWSEFETYEVFLPITTA